MPAIRLPKRKPLMKCEDVEKELVSYLDHEVAPGERRLMEQHLAGCDACQQKLAATAATQKAATQALQSLAARAEPSPEAWELLQSRLATEQQELLQQQELLLIKKTVWNARPAPRAGRTPVHTFQGAFLMRTKFVIPAVVAVVVIAVFGFFLAQNATPVSAQQILERADQARNAVAAAQGIRHTRVETYLNSLIMGQKSGIQKTVTDSYVDRSTGIYRQVTTDGSTGQMLDASAYDGSYIYSRNKVEGEATNSLTLYRTPQSLDKVANLMPDSGTADMEKFFDQTHHEADNQRVTKETWTDGRPVYVLTNRLPEGAAQKFQISNLNGDSIMVFDAKTYDLIEDRTVMHQNGKDVVLSSYRKLVDEILPAGSPVVWDLSDVQGITFVDDPDREHGDLLPEIITPQELAAHTSDGYLLKNVPAGFTLELSAPPKQEHEQYYIYMASYRNADNGYFMVQSGKAPEKIGDLGSDTYKTASGLTLYYLPEQGAKSEAPEYTIAIVKAPDGGQFIITSSLPRAQVQKLAEELVQVK